jgi:2-polyprenyl-3-methyl-5-hydroxy-6-metoxy-1,4-benzoquinol methylase
MTPLRDELYAKYVSAFKGDPTAHVNVPKFWAWCDHKIRPWLATLPPDARVLDLGCGPGYLLGYLAASGWTRAEGIDLSAEQVAIATSMGHRAAVADVFAYLAEHPGAFDAILAIDFIEHFGKDELRALTAALATALVPGGRLILQTPNGQGLFAGHVIYGDLTHGTIFTPGSLTQLLTLAGFTTFEFREAGGAPVGLKGRLRVAAWSVLRAGLQILNKLANGRTQSVWTDNMLCSCRSAAGRGNV